MDTTKIIRNVGSILLAATLVSGCSAIADKAGEKIAEKGMEAAAGGDANVDFDTDGDGKVTIESSEGSMVLGGGEVPEDFPESVPLPDGFEVESAMTIGSDEEQTFSLHMVSPDADVQAISDDLKSQVEDAGFEITSTNSMNDNDSKMLMFSFNNDEWTGSVTTSSGEEATAVNYNVMTSEPDD